MLSTALFQIGLLIPSNDNRKKAIRIGYYGLVEVGLDLESLFQSEQFHDSIILNVFK